MLPLLLLACSEIVTVTPSQSGCTDFNYGNPADSYLSMEPLGDGASITRENILLDESGLQFEPDIVIDRGVMSLHERWVEGETEDQFCYTASVFVQDWTGELELRWYVEGNAIPFRTLLLER